MALRAKVRGQWRVISKAMARRFRARGIEVVDDNDPVKKLFRVAPYETVHVNTPAQERESPAEVLVDMLGVTSADVAQQIAEHELAVRSRIDADSFHSAAVTLKAEFDLTDEELERLTAPDGGEG